MQTPRDQGKTTRYTKRGDVWVCHTCKRELNTGDKHPKDAGHNFCEICGHKIVQYDYEH